LFAQFKNDSLLPNGDLSNISWRLGWDWTINFDNSISEKVEFHQNISLVLTTVFKRGLASWKPVHYSLYNKVQVDPFLCGLSFPSCAQTAKG
jgi:hypothetical protein